MIAVNERCGILGGVVLLGLCCFVWHTLPFIIITIIIIRATAAAAAVTAHWEWSRTITQMVTNSRHLTAATHTKNERLSLINSVLKRCFFQFVNRILVYSRFNFSISLLLCIYFHLFPPFQGTVETRGVLRCSLFFPSSPPQIAGSPACVAYGIQFC